MLCRMANTAKPSRLPPLRVWLLLQLLCCRRCWTNTPRLPLHPCLLVLCLSLPLSQSLQSMWGFGPSPVGLPQVLLACTPATFGKLFCVPLLASGLPDEERSTLLLDFTNAFNSISRKSMFVEFRRHLPGLPAWMESCYSCQPLLHLGKDVIHSCCGVQQGDPLGPLGFTLTLHPIIKRITAEVPSMPGTLMMAPWWVPQGFFRLLSTSLSLMAPLLGSTLTEPSPFISSQGPVMNPVLPCHLRFQLSMMGSPFLAALLVLLRSVRKCSRPGSARSGSPWGCCTTWAILIWRPPSSALVLHSPSSPIFSGPVLPPTSIRLLWILML